LVLVNTHAETNTTISKRTQVEQLDNVLPKVAYNNCVIVPFTLIASARSLTPASPSWLKSRLHPDRITADNEEERHPLLVDLVLKTTTRTSLGRWSTNLVQGSGLLNKTFAEAMKETRLKVFGFHA
jgi:hypothetical protein